MIDRVEVEAALTKWGADAPLSRLLEESPSLHSGDATALPHVHPDHSLTLALERMGAVRYTVLPVVSRSNIRQLLGVVTLDDILETFGLSQPSSPWRQQ